MNSKQSTINCFFITRYANTYDLRDSNDISSIFSFDGSPEWRLFKKEISLLYFAVTLAV